MHRRCPPLALLQAVWFAYPLRPTAWVLRGLHLHIAPGRKVAAPNREGQPSSVRPRTGPGSGDTPDLVDRSHLPGTREYERQEEEDDRRPWRDKRSASG